MSDKIKCCTRHDKNVPFIFTGKFPGKEWWCPHCGHTIEFFGMTRDLPLSDAFKKLHDDLRKEAGSFLHGETDEWEYGR